MENSMKAIVSISLVYNGYTKNIIIRIDAPPYRTAYLPKEAHPALYDMLLETIKANKKDD